ncbi:MAG: NAD(P)-binding protein [Pseudomonadota bacterium]
MASLPRIAVVGAGVAGITCTARLHAAGFPVQLFDKSRGLGGRLATRRWPSGIAFDHGAPHFTAESEVLRAALAAAGDAVEHWQPRTDGESVNSFVGVPRMNSWLKPALAGVAPQLNTQIQAVAPAGDGWSLAIDGRRTTVQADAVILATPSPQAAVMAAVDTDLAARLAAVDYAPCWALLLQLTDHAPVARDVSTAFGADSPLVWLGRNAGKPGRDDDNTGWVAHASEAWSRAQLELTTDAAIAALLPSVLDALGMPRTAVAKTQAHRWRYANVRRAAEAPYLHNAANTLFAIGDGCLGGGVEGAFTSGATLADALIDRHS